MHVFVFAYRTVAFVPDGEVPTAAILWVSAELVSTWPAITKGLGAGRYLVDDDYHEVRFSPPIEFIIWRVQLASLAGYTQLAALNGDVGDDAPFVQLTGFGEQQGVYGPEACSNLHQDFVDFDDRAAAVGLEFQRHYEAFKDAFEFAKNGGALQLI